MDNDDIETDYTQKMLLVTNQTKQIITRKKQTHLTIRGEKMY